MGKRVLWGLILVFSFLLVLSSCQDNSSSPDTSEPDPPDPDELVINPDTKDIDSQEWLSNVQKIDSTDYTLTFNDGFNEASEWEVDDIIVSAEGEGLLRKVTSVNQTDEGIVVNTEQATLVDYIQQGKIQETVSLGIEDVQKVEYFQKGVQLLTEPNKVNQHELYKEKRNGLPWNLDTELTAESGREIELFGEYLLEPDLTLDVDISWLARLQHFELSYELRNTINLGMRASAELKVAETIKLAEVTFNPVVFTIPPVPVIVTPKLVVNMGIAGEITGEIVTNVTYVNSLKLGSRYERGSGWSEILDRSDDFNFNPPSIELDARMEAFLSPQFEMALYGVLSGYLTASLYSAIEAGLTREPWWEMFLGIRAGVGAKATILSKDLVDHSKPDLLDVRWTVAQAESNEEPTVATVLVKDVTEVSATVHGKAERESNSSPILERGVCWSSDDETPTKDDECEESGSGEGEFTVSLTRLDSGTDYFATAYAINSAGTAYGDVESFSTVRDATRPSVRTRSISSIDYNSAVSGGEITSDGGESITARGVCWNTSGDPDRNDSCTSDGTGTGSFTSEISGLNSDTRYYVRAYAFNSLGTSFGDERDFRTEEEPNDPPSVEIIGGPNNNDVIDERDVVFEWSGSDTDGSVEEFEIELDGPLGESFTTDNTEYEFEDLENGEYTFRIRAVDNDGDNSGWAERDFLIYVEPPNKAPSVEIHVGTNDGAVLSTDTANFEWEGYDSDGTIQEYEVSLDGFVEEEFTTSNTSEEFNDLVNGEYTFNVRAIDNDDAKSDWARRSFTVDVSEEIELPIVTSATISLITENAAAGGGEVTDDGGAEVTARGVCWNTTQNPTTGDTCTSDGSGTGVFTSDLTGLTADTEYFVRAYATNSEGTAYGSQESFTTTASQAEAPLFMVTLTLSDDVNTLNELKFGIKQTAETTEAPPAPPEGSLHAYFANGDEELFEDFRDQSSETQTWELQYSIGDGEELTLSWDLDPESFEGNLTIQDENGNVLSYMKSESEFKISINEYQHLTIEFK